MTGPGETTAIGAIPAATLVLLRDRAGAPPELLMIERAGSMAFAAGALVFRAGGSTTPTARPPPRSAAGTDDAAARLAAIRETIEEVGVAVGVAPAPDAAALAALRAGLARGEPLAPLLAGAGLALDLDALCPFARWRPAGSVRRIYDTRFYLASAPAGADAQADGGESVRAIWTTAEDALADAAAGRHRIIYPTRRNLERLALAAGHVDACALAARHPIVTITPHVESRDGEDWLCIPADRGYPVTAERLADVPRG